MREEGFYSLEVGGQQVGGAFPVKVVSGSNPLAVMAQLSVVSGFCPGGYFFHGTGLFLNDRGLIFDYRQSEWQLSNLWRSLHYAKKSTDSMELGIVNGGYLDGEPRFSLEDEYIRGYFKAESIEENLVLTIDFNDCNGTSRVLIEGTNKILLPKAIKFAERAYDAYSFNDKPEVKEVAVEYK